MPILKLLCEYEDRPINVQTQRPRFCWALDDNTVREQLSYRIIVSEDKALTQPVWDSGTVLSRASLGIVYNGAPLRDCTRYYWQVKISCRDGFNITGSSFLKPPYPPKLIGKDNGFPIPSLWTAIPYCLGKKYSWTLPFKARLYLRPRPLPSAYKRRAGQRSLLGAGLDQTTTKPYSTPYWT